MAVYQVDQTDNQQLCAAECNARRKSVTNERAMHKTTLDVSSVLGYLIFVPVAMGLCIFFISFVGRYYTFYDIGINAAANSWALLFFQMPMAFAFFLGIGWFTYHELQKLGQAVWLAFACGMGAMILAVLGAFLIEVVRFAGYPKYPGVWNGGFGGFLKYFWKDWSGYWANGGIWAEIGGQVFYTLIVGLVLLATCMGGYVLLKSIGKHKGQTGDLIS